MSRVTFGLSRHQKSHHVAPRANGCAHAGQGLVEFALTLPLLILMMVGILDLGRVYFAYITVVNASREGARWGAANPADCSGIIAHAKQEADDNIVKQAQLFVTMTPTCPGGTAGNPLQVTVRYNFQLILAVIFGGGTIPLRASTEMLVFGQ